jgi:hypothetical protein
MIELTLNGNGYFQSYQPRTMQIMSKAIINKPGLKTAFVLTSCIFLACFLVTLTSKFATNPSILSNAILADLLITAPVAWLIMIRKTQVSKFTGLRVFVVGLLIAGWLLKGHQNTLLHFTKTWISPLIELFVIIFIVRKFHVANRKTKAAGLNSADFLLYCRSVLCRVIGNEKAGNIIASEIGVLYYSFLMRCNKVIDYKSNFTSYKENGIILVLATFLSLFLVETIGTHLLLSLWSRQIACVLTVFGLYTSLQLYAHINAIKARPISLNSDSLNIRNGLAGDAFIKYANIEKFELSKAKPAGRNAIKIALINGLENHNCIIYLKEPIEVTKVFGIKKITDTVLFFVDRPKDFAMALNTKLTTSTC